MVSSIATTIISRYEADDDRVVVGKSVLTLDALDYTEDVVVDGLKMIKFFRTITKGTTQKGYVVNADFPLASNVVTLYIEDDDGVTTVYWKARGIQ